jgi:hypothetical protein
MAAKVHFYFDIKYLDNSLPAVNDWDTKIELKNKFIRYFIIHYNYLHLINKSKTNQLTLIYIIM